MRGAYYKSTVGDFLKEASDSIVGKLNVNYSESFSQQWTRGTTSWSRSIEIFKKAFEEIILENTAAGNWYILLEYEIPRLLKRVDAVILAEDLIFVIEYKDDSKKVELWQLRQVEDYALDLKDFHFASRGRTIIPVLLSPFAKKSSELPKNQDDFDIIKPIIKVNSQNFTQDILQAFNNYHKNESEVINPLDWIESMYEPTPTIIQAAQVLFAGHEVENITKSGADAENIEKTTQYLIKTIKQAKKSKKKIVGFVTGVPGAGKTLVGLNLIHKKNFDDSSDESAAYFSGNGPLIKVLREALARDKKKRENVPKSEASHVIDSKIQNLHQFIKDGILNEKGRKKSGKTVHERIVVFDEAQRCWDGNHFFNKTKRNENRQSADSRFDAIRKSEAEVLFEIMDKFEDWAVIVALV
ncbi:MAG: DNA/RNA helicase domain-containing protein, partial [Bacteriovorax sp.]